MFSLVAAAVALVFAAVMETHDVAGAVNAAEKCPALSRHLVDQGLGRLPTQRLKLV